MERSSSKRTFSRFMVTSFSVLRLSARACPPCQSGATGGNWTTPLVELRSWLPHRGPCVLKCHDGEEQYTKGDEENDEGESKLAPGAILRTARIVAAGVDPDEANSGDPCQPVAP